MRQANERASGTPLESIPAGWPHGRHGPEKTCLTPQRELKEALRALRDAAYHFLVRCHKTGFIDERRLREAAELVGTGINVSDLIR